MEFSGWNYKRGCALGEHLTEGWERVRPGGPKLRCLGIGIRYSRWPGWLTPESLGGYQQIPGVWTEHSLSF